MLRILSLVAVLAAALFAGAALYINVAEQPARLTLDTRSAAAQWAPSYMRATWMQAPLAVVSLVCGVAVWLMSSSTGWLIAAALIGLVVPFTFAQVSGTYGHAEAQTIVENCGNTVILRCSASEGGDTARFASKLIGEREVIREHVTTNEGGGLFSNARRSTSTSTQHVTESAVLPSEIEQLPDLHGFLKFASTPEWRRVILRLPT